MGNRKFNFNVDVYETFGGILENDFFFLTDDLVCSMTKRSLTEKLMNYIIIDIFSVRFASINY